MVARNLPKVEARVRFPSPARHLRGFSGLVLSPRQSEQALY